MNWEILSGLAELSSALAVLVTLIYLAIQVRQNNTFAQAQAMQARTDTQINMISFVMSDPKYLEAINTVMTYLNEPGKGEVFEQDKRDALVVLSVIRATLENTYEQYTKGLISRDFYQGVTVQTIKTYGPAMLALDMWLTPGFRREMQEVVGR